MTWHLQHNTVVVFWRYRSTAATVGANMRFVVSSPLFVIKQLHLTAAALPGPNCNLVKGCCLDCPGGCKASRQRGCSPAVQLAIKVMQRIRHAAWRIMVALLLLLLSQALQLSHCRYRSS
jgi:hypothetical protein